MRKLLLALLLCSLLTPALADDFGQSYDLFEEYYAQSITFINDNTGRHLLPHTPARDFDKLGNRFYIYAGGALRAEVYLDDLASQIARCCITLTAPANMQYGDNLYRDFITAGYHSYALIMAMHDSADPAERYALVEAVNSGLAANGGVFETEVGDYRLTCTSQNGVATMLFENALLLSSIEEAPVQESAPAEEDAEDSGEEDEFLG